MDHREKPLVYYSCPDISVDGEGRQNGHDDAWPARYDEEEEVV